MAGFDTELTVEVYGNHIIVTLPGTHYSGPTSSQKASGGWATDMVHEDDLRIGMTSAEFLAKAWKVANDKARELRVDV
jgi:hypothetical protein